MRIQVPSKRLQSERSLLTSTRFFANGHRLVELRSRRLGGIRQFSLNTFTVSDRLVTSQFDRFTVTSIPEPSAFGLVAMAAAPFLIRRRKRAVANRPRHTNPNGAPLPENRLGGKRA